MGRSSLNDTETVDRWESMGVAHQWTLSNIGTVNYSRIALLVWSANLTPREGALVDLAFPLNGQHMALRTRGEHNVEVCRFATRSQLQSH